MTSDRVMAFVCLEEALEADNDSWGGYFQAMMAASGLEISLMSTHSERGTPSAVLRTGRARIAVVAHPFRVPGNVFADDEAQGSLWPKYKRAVDAHRAHIVVAAYEGDDQDGDCERRAVPGADAVFRVAALLAEMPTACAVYVSSSRLTFPPVAFRDLMNVKSRKLPVDVAVRANWFGMERPGGQGLGLTTEGLASLRLPEIHHPVTGESAEMIGARIEALASRMMHKREFIEDGDIVEDGPDQRIRAEVGFENGVQTIRLVFVPVAIEGGASKVVPIGIDPVRRRVAARAS